MNKLDESGKARLRTEGLIGTACPVTPPLGGWYGVPNDRSEK